MKQFPSSLDNQGTQHFKEISVAAASLGQEEDEFMSVYDSDDSLKIANEKVKKDYSNSEPEEIDWSSICILNFDDAVCLA